MHSLLKGLRYTTYGFRRSLVRIRGLHNGVTVVSEGRPKISLLERLVSLHTLVFGKGQVLLSVDGFGCKLPHPLQVGHVVEQFQVVADFGDLEQDILVVASLLDLLQDRGKVTVGI